MNDQNFTFNFRQISNIFIGGSKGGSASLAPPVQFLSFSYTFQQKSCQIIGFYPNSGAGTPFVWEILGLPLIFIFTVSNEVVKVMFLQACVCPHGGCLPQCMLGYHTHTPLGEDTPPGSRHPPGSRPPQEQTHPPEQTPPEETPPEQTPPPSRHPPERRPLLRTVRIPLECILVFPTCNKAKLHIMIRGKVPL